MTPPAETTKDDARAQTPIPPDVRKLQELLHKGELVGHYYVLLLGLRTFDTPGILERVSRGLSYNALERFARNLALPKNTVADLIQIPIRTLARRKEEGRLHVDESDRLLRASRILAKALALFEGDIAQARRWLNEEQPALDGATPLQFARTELGAREVEDLIGRLEHGVPS